MLSKGRPGNLSSAPLSLPESDSAGGREYSAGEVFDPSKEKGLPQAAPFPCSAASIAAYEPPSSSTPAPGSGERGGGAPEPTSDALNCPARHMHSWPQPTFWHKPGCFCEARGSSPVSAAARLGVSKSLASLSLCGSYPRENSDKTFGRGLTHLLGVTGEVLDGKVFQRMSTKFHSAGGEPSCQGQCSQRFGVQPPAADCLGSWALARPPAGSMTLASCLPSRCLSCLRYKTE